MFRALVSIETETELLDAAQTLKLMPVTLLELLVQWETTAWVLQASIGQLV